MRITRGSTLRGYSGFSRKIDRDGYKIVRPLINLTKDEIADFANQNNIKYVSSLIKNKQNAINAHESRYNYRGKCSYHNACGRFGRK